MAKVQKIKMVSPTGKVKMVGPDALAHWENLGYTKAKEQPKSKETDERPVHMIPPTGIGRKVVKANVVKHYLGLGYVLLEDCQRMLNANGTEQHVPKDKVKQAEERGLMLPENFHLNKDGQPKSKAERRAVKAAATPAPEKVPNAPKKKGQSDPLLGLQKAGDEHTKQIIELLDGGYPRAEFARILKVWDVNCVKDLPVADRADFLMDLKSNPAITE